MRLVLLLLAHHRYGRLDEVVGSIQHTSISAIFKKADSTKRKYGSAPVSKLSSPTFEKEVYSLPGRLFPITQTQGPHGKNGHHREIYQLGHRTVMAPVVGCDKSGLSLFSGNHLLFFHCQAPLSPLVLAGQYLMPSSSAF